MPYKSRVALVLPRFSRYGGVEQFAFRLSEALVAEGLHVDVVCGRCESEPPAGVLMRVVGRPAGFRFMKQLWFLLAAERAIRSGHYDVVMGFGSSLTQDILRVGGGPQAAFWQRSERAWPAGWPRFSKRLRRWLNPASWVTGWLDERQYTRTPRLVCVSHAVKDWVLETWPHISEPEVIYNLPDLSQFQPPTPEERLNARRYFDLPEHGLIISTATTNFALKATGPLIQALALVSQQHPGAVLAVAGGRDPRDLQRMSKELGIAAQVHFLGKVEHMPTLYHASDLFALPSYYDACSNAVLEARASGLPTLSSTSNGSSRFLPPEWIVEDPGNVEELAAHLLSMAKTPWQAFDFSTTLTKLDAGAGIPAWVALIQQELNRLPAQRLDTQNP